MSDRPVSRLFEIGRLGLVATSLIGSLALGGGSIAVAQDASPEATAAGPCVPLTGITQPVATPDMAAMGTPEAATEPVASPADDATAETATAVLQNALNCDAAHDEDALATLVTPNFVAALGGYASIEEAVADGFFSEPLMNPELGSVVSYDDGTLGVNITYWQTEYQIVSERWVLADVDGEWKLDGVRKGDPANVDGDSAAVGINLVENGDGTYAIAPNRPNVTATDVLILQAINKAENLEAHELVVVKLPEGATPDGIFDGSISEDDVEFIGFVVVPTPGDVADMTLVGLPAGVYTLLCFFPGPDGTPHAMNGMVAQFEVTAPAE
jgi:hypothetical protein